MVPARPLDGLGKPLVRRRILLSLAVVTPLGFLFKLYAGPGHRWLNNSAAGVLYEVFWCLVLLFIWPRQRYATRIAVTVLAVTSLLEVLQLWHPSLLEQVRTTFLGRALIGTTFAWGDFPYYVLGCALSWLWMQALCRPSSGAGSTG
jgi:hypothetical protein